MNQAPGGIPIVRFVQGTAFAATYNFVIRPTISYYTDMLYGLVHSKKEEDSYQLTNFLRHHKASVSFSCNFTHDVLLPVADLYTYKYLATNSIPLLTNSEKPIQTAKMYLDYNFITRPALLYGTTNIYSIANSNAEKDSYQVTNVLRHYKTSVSFLCNFTYDILLPVADFYTYKSIATNNMPFFINLDKTNKWLANPWFIHFSPVLFRSINIAIDLQDQCSPEITNFKEISIRASEFTGWFNLFNFYLKNIIPPKHFLGLITKLSAIYTILYLDNVESWLLKGDQKPLMSLTNATLPLTKNPISTTCKIPVDTWVTHPIPKGILDSFCNFLGELSYNRFEGFMADNKTVFDFSEILNISSPQNQYLALKSVWKTIHQLGEREIVDKKALGKPAGYRMAPFFFPRSYPTTKLRKLFNMQDSSDYLDPDLLELKEFVNFDQRNIRITNTDSFITLLEQYDECISPSKISGKITNITDNFWGKSIDTDATLRCTIADLYSRHYNPFEVLPPLQRRLSTVNSCLKQKINYSASICLEKDTPQDQSQTTESLLSSFVKAFTDISNDIAWNIPKLPDFSQMPNILGFTLAEEALT